MKSSPSFAYLTTSFQAADFFLCRRGLSRIEIVVTAGVIFLGLSLTILYLGQSRTTSRARECEARQIELGRTLLFQAQITGHFAGSIQPYQGKDSTRPIAWPVVSLRYLSRPLDRKTGELPGQDVLGRYAIYHDNLKLLSHEAGQAELSAMFLRELVCPEDPRIATAAPSPSAQEGTRKPGQAALSYVLNCGLPDFAESPSPDSQEFWPDYPENGIGLDQMRSRGDLSRNSLEAVESADGTAFTFLLSENADATLWTEAGESSSGFLWSTFYGSDGKADDRYPMPQVLAINELRGERAKSASESALLFARPSSYHAEPGKDKSIRGVFVLFCDGHTKFVSEQLDRQLYMAFMTPQGTHTRQPGTGTSLESPWKEERVPASEEQR
ncbi:MAG: hypothetical protein ACO1RA_02110 [Planctomycetaceae bacterium]